MDFLRNLSTTKRNVYNILLLGESGVGKSTAVNAFSNYLKYATFDEASKSDFSEMISSKIILADPKSGEPVIIKSGFDVNELGNFESTTISQKTHTFKYLNNLIRLIDTPGFGGTTEIYQDTNFYKIMNFLNYFKELHGIIILFKSSYSRLNVFFHYCITELLTNLHKSAYENIVFCFTFSRNTYFVPGDGYSILSQTIKNELTEVKLKLELGRNCFFIDNEVCRFLVAKKIGYPIPECAIETYRGSWEKSVEQVDKMFKNIIDKKPHSLESPISLNTVRRLIFQIAEPMVRLHENTMTNIYHIKREQEKLKNTVDLPNINKIELIKTLTIEIDNIEQIQLEYSSFVCTAASCIEVVNENKIHYVKRCHEHCEIQGINVNTIVLNSSFEKSCSNCGCPKAMHMHQLSVFEKVKRTVLYPIKNKKIKTNQERFNFALKYLQRLVKELWEEIVVIEDIASKCSYFLKENSNTPYNNFIEQFMDLMIGEERKKVSSIPGYDSKKLDSLEKMKEKHIALVHTQSRNQIGQKIYKYIDQLSKLKNSGQQFRKMMETTKMIDRNSTILLETPPTVIHKIDKKKKNKKKYYYQIKSK